MLELRARLNAKNVRINMVQSDINTITELSERMGVTKQAISMWLSGKNFPSDENLIELARVLNCEVADLVILPKYPALPPLISAVSMANAFGA